MCDPRRSCGWQDFESTRHAQGLLFGRFLAVRDEVPKRLTPQDIREATILLHFEAHGSREQEKSTHQEPKLMVITVHLGSIGYVD